MGSDLIYEPFEKDGRLLTIEEHRRSQEPVNTNTMPHVCLQHLTLLLWIPQMGDLDVQSRYKYLEVSIGGKDGSTYRTDSLPKTQSSMAAVEREAHHITTSMITNS